MNAARTVRVNLDFTATTSQAEAALSRLNTNLRNISSQTNLDTGGLRLPEQLNTASVAAIKLRENLQNAINVDTGRLDLSKFNHEMEKSGMSLKQYRDALVSLGPTGQAAFMDLSKAILASETPLKQTNVLVDKLWDSLKRTAGWQLSSTAIHRFIGTIQTAYNYAQDLNKSLNDIRIVTGYGSDRMAEFAKNANKAAKQLSATTLDYTNASLIYYQQGLDDKAVQERTDVTVKMANVTGTAAQTVSDQLTAVWENFMKDGEHTAEWYADVMTALGAATASSTDEIAEGLEKFAAVADTVGLSYEYATAALTTITAKTRQSADVVGTALKTLFARIEGLNLGETLDDGTTLNKYSSALEAVGVNIKNEAGELKDMDEILDEIGAKWNTIGKDQQIALAQTVAGVRQYNQFIALMDNWDFMQENLQTVAKASGTLDEQAQIYAESWEAAKKRVQAAAEGIYQDLLKDDFFIWLTDAFGSVLEFIDKIIDSLGGLSGVLPGIALLVNKIFGDKIIAGAQTLAHNLMNLTAAGRAANMKRDVSRYEEVAQLQKGLNPNSGLRENNEAAAVSTTADRVLAIQKQILGVKGKITEEDRKHYQIILESVQASGEELQARAKQLDLAQEEARLLANDIRGKASFGSYEHLKGAGSSSLRAIMSQYDNGTSINDITLPTSKGAQQGVIDQLNSNLGLNGSAALQLDDLTNKTQKFQQALQSLSTASVQSFIKDFDGLGESIRNNARQLAEFEHEAEQLTKLKSSVGNWQKDPNFNLEGYKQQFRDLGYSISDAADAEELLTAVSNAEAEALQKSRRAAAGNTDQIEQFAKKYKLSREEVQRFANQLKEAEKRGLSYKEYLKQTGEAAVWAGKNIENTSKKVSKIEIAKGFANNLMSLQMGFASLRTFFTTLADDSASAGDKIMSFVSALAFGISGIVVPLTSGMNSLTTALRSYTAAEIVAEAATSFSNKAKSRKIILENQAKIAAILSANASKDLTAAELAEKLAAEGIGTEKTRLGIAEAILNKQKGQSLIVTGLNTLAHKLEEKALSEENASLGLNIALWITKKLAALGVVGAIMAVVGAVAILTGAVMGIIALVNNIKNNSISGRLEGLTEESKNAAEAADEATNKFKELKDAISDYQNGVKSLADLTKGTQEFEDATEKANEAAKKLIKTYNIKNWSIDPETGLIKINDQELEDAQNQAKAEKTEARSTASAFSAAQTKVQIQKALLDLSDRYGTHSNKAQNEEYGGSVSQIDKIITAMNNFNGGADLFFSNIEENAAKALGYNSFDDLSEVQKEFIQNIENDSEAFIKHAKAILKDKDAIEGDRKDSMLEQFQADVEGFTSSDQQKEIVDAVYANAADQAETDAKEKYGNLSGDALYEEYAKLKGASSYDTGKWLDGKERFYDANGQEIANVSDAVMREALQADYVQQQLKGENQQSKVEDIVKLEHGNDTDSAIAKMVTTQGDWDSGIQRLTEQELAALQEMTDAQKADYADIFNSFGLDLNKAIASVTGDNAEHAGKLQASGAKKHQEEEIKSTAETYGLTEEMIESQVEALQEQKEAYNENKDAAIQAVKEQLRLQKAGTNLNKIWKDNSAAIKKWTQGLDDSIETQQAVVELQNALNDVFKTKVSTDFIKKNFDVIQSAMEGDTEAVQRFQDLAAQDVLLTVKGVSDFGGLDQQLQDLHNTIMAYAEQSDFTIGAQIEDQEFINSCQAMVDAAGMTATQAQQYFNAMGYDVEFDTGKTTNTQTYTYHKLDVEKTKEAGGMPQFEEEPTVIEASTQVAGTAIKTITPNGNFGGNIDFSNAKYNGGSGGKPSGGGGGGGGSSQKDKKKSSDEIERYHVVKKQLDNLSREYDNLSAAKDRAFGANRLRVMDQEAAKLEEQIAAQKRYVDEIDSYYSQDRAAIAAYGAVFDEDGIITNYEQIMQEQLDIFNVSLTDEAEESYNEFKDILNQYEETLELKLSEADKLIEQEYDKISLQLEKITYSVEIKVQIHDDQIDFLERRLDRLSNSERRQYDSYLIQQKKMLELQQKRLTTQQGIDDLQAAIAEHEAQGLEITDEENEQLRTYKETLADIDDQIFDIKFSIIGDIGTTFDNYFDDLDYYIDRISTLNDMMETTRDTLDLMGYDNLDIFNRINGQLLSNQRVMLGMSQKKLSSATDEVDYWKRLAVAVEGIDSLDDLKDSPFWEDANDQIKKIAENAALAGDSIKVVKDAINDQLKEATERQLETQQEIYESINDIVQAIEDNWVDAIEKVVAVQKKGLLNDIDYAVDRYGDLADLNDLYLSNSKKIYELNKLNRTILQDISKTDNIAAKSKLKDVLEQVNALQNSNAQMSEYELKTLQAKYDLRLAEIALEEAQEAKSQVRLVRDNEGNWGYMYTADAEAVSKAEQDVEDKMQALQDIQEETMRDTGEKILSIQQEYYDALSDIYTNASLTQEERNKREEALRESTMKQLSYYTDQYDKALKQSGMNFKDTILGTMYPEYENLQKFNDNFTSSADTTFTMIQDQYKATTKYYQELAKAMGITDENVLNDLGSMKEEIAKAMIAAQENMQTAISNSQENFDATTKNMDNLVKTIDEMGEALREWVKEMTKLAVVFNSNADYFDLMIKAVKNNDMDSAEKYAEYRAMKISLDPNSYGQYSWDSKEAMVKDFQEQGVQISSEKADRLWDKYNNTTQKYDTGGYTGEWGQDGKLAVLHQKELVLNASDTANMLDIVNIVRDIVQQIDAQALYSRGRRFDLPRIETRAETLEQNVHIEANFPNATSHQEIEQAFDNLINLASQYANKK